MTTVQLGEEKVPAVDNKPAAFGSVLCRFLDLYKISKDTAAHAHTACPWFLSQARLLAHTGRRSLLIQLHTCLLFPVSPNSSLSYRRKKQYTENWNWISAIYLSAQANISHTDGFIVLCANEAVAEGLKSMAVFLRACALNKAQTIC